MTTEHGTIEVSHKRLPIFDTRFSGLSTPAEFEAHFEEYVRVMQLNGGPVVLLIDFRPARLIRIGPARIRLAADIVRKFQPLLSPFVAAEARVFDTSVHRGISGSVVRIAGAGPWPIRGFERIAPAEMWLMRTLHDGR